MVFFAAGMPHSHTTTRGPAGLTIVGLETFTCAGGAVGLELGVTVEVETARVGSCAGRLKSSPRNEFT